MKEAVAVVTASLLVIKSSIRYENMIQIKNLLYEYFRRDDQGEVTEIVEAVDGVNLTIEQGEFVVILGHNGSGKSTLARHLNGMLQPTEGTVVIDGLDTREEELLWQIRKKNGMVFQNPDNQIVGTMVEEDTAFGPENLGVETEEIWNRVANSLEAVGMKAYRQASPNHLSGGQKQRVAIAGVLAMKPDCIILDEATAMLDPEGRKGVLSVAHQLNKEKNITIILITHNMEEAIGADHVYVMEKGKVVMEGTPQEVFVQREAVERLGLELPLGADCADFLRNKKLPIKPSCISIDDVIDELLALDVTEPVSSDAMEYNGIKRGLKRKIDLKHSLACDQISYVYQKGTVNETPAIRDISCTFVPGEFVAIIGHTGSGKSTFIQTLNGLLQPTSGDVYYNGRDIREKGLTKKELCQKVGIVFQYPEHQLFADTVFEDVMFGPAHSSLSQVEAQKRAFEALKMVGLGDDIYDMSPFELSGGQQRRVAIAGVIAMAPEYLVLDEPAAGLDPRGRREIFALLKALQEQGMGIILISHSMEDVAEYADRILVFHNGKLEMDGSVEEVFNRVEELEQIQLAAPESYYFMKQLRERGCMVTERIYRREEVKQELARYFLGSRG